ncbi:hypothetical protein [Streptococcus macacae]|uniref:Uncharacterized protein n=1 Tax=Streptococcus macacae NCTC 11558 TaxID=764298 RepID=G5JUN0_9STRE|nr:hypothetical protein [Streptococcus macacae]EHJ53214.1 hypothetical protein STRMA_1020 [Streptococcus macacae NCTC 11558]SUN78847.1 Uncharacterised protein [Streptococcus macacae NCTC 11558]
MKEKILSLFQVYKDKGHRTALFASFSTVRNVAYSLGMLVLAWLSWSVFLVINGSYQLILSLIRILNVFSYSRAQRGLVQDRSRIIRITGVLIILLGLVYFLINLYFYRVRPVEEISHRYMLMTATIAFVKLGSSIWGFISNRKSKDPEVISIRLLSLVDATVSIVTTQRVILTFVEGGESAAKSTPLFGMAISLGFVLVGLYLIHRKQK